MGACAPGHDPAGSGHTGFLQSVNTSDMPYVPLGFCKKRNSPAMHMELSGSQFPGSQSERRMALCEQGKLPMSAMVDQGGNPREII
jgi:hypothetical protein